ncbi:orotidine-5'-phosphate decarboxylase [Ectobacillus polymachus]|uniref:orotidine-5'-phosphate decarboxylase n=1 Tax=Ectobacillus polymachus TaxID=1508806 RepID=UPI003A849C81
MSKSLMVALDFPSKQEVEAFLSPFQEPLYVKIGMELFYKEGPEIIHYVKEKGHSVFLDLKLHDIPNTVKRAMRNLASLGVDMVNVHAAGGSLMMKAAIEGLEEGAKEGKRPKIIAVTQLTSTSEQLMQQELLIHGSMDETVLHYAKNAQISGMDGVVCSVHEVNSIHNTCGTDFITVTPGIRLSNDVGDQVRVATPKLARELGSDFIVVGRSITQADNPKIAYETVRQQWEG